MSFLHINKLLQETDFYGKESSSKSSSPHPLNITRVASTSYVGYIASKTASVSTKMFYRLLLAYSALPASNICHSSSLTKCNDTRSLCCFCFKRPHLQTLVDWPSVTRPSPLGWGLGMRLSVIGASLSEPHNSKTALHNACVCLLAAIDRKF